MTEAESKKELAAFKRRMSNAHRELRRAVERASAVDLRRGHIAEARRLCADVKRAADEALEVLSRKG